MKKALDLEVGIEMVDGWIEKIIDFSGVQQC
jgi:hypothetical protein